MNLVYSLIFGCLCAFLSLSAAHANSADKTGNLSAFEQYAKDQKEGFNAYKEQHRKFISLLKQEWQAYKAEQSLVRDAAPKLPTAPVLKGSDFIAPPMVVFEQPEAINIPPKNIPNRDLIEDAKPEEIVVSPSTTPLVIPLVDDGQTTAEEPQDKRKAFEFYGQQLKLAPLPDITLVGRSQDDLQVYWELNSEADFDLIFKEIEQLKTTLSLSDWALFLLIQEYVKQHVDDGNQAIAANWFLLNNLGYEARIANGDNTLILLMTAEQSLFDMPYYDIEGKKHYQMLGDASTNVRSYRGNFDKKNKALDMSFNKTLTTVADIHYRDITTTLTGEAVALKLPYDMQRIKYLSTYPQLDLRYYFAAPVDPITSQALTQSISVILTGSQDTQVSQLLHLIHRSFPYAVDDQQFGYENYLTVEESLHYQASDCEDRSVLFAWLAINLLQEPVVALNYEGHVATALTRDGRLVSADPTYLGADLGDIMPDYQGVRPKVIRF